MTTAKQLAFQIDHLILMEHLLEWARRVCVGAKGTGRHQSHLYIYIYIIYLIQSLSSLQLQGKPPPNRCFPKCSGNRIPLKNLAFRKPTKCPGKQLPVSYLCPCRDDAVSVNHHYYDIDIVAMKCCTAGVASVRLHIVRRSTVNIHTSSHFNHLRPWQKSHESWTAEAVNGQFSK